MEGTTTVHAVGTFSAGASIRGICTCGWRGPARTDSTQALSDASKHKNGGAALLDGVDGQRLLLIRESARNRTGSDARWSDVQFLLAILDRAIARLSGRTL